MGLINLTKEQNEKLKEKYVEAMDALEELKKPIEMGNKYAEQLGLIAFIKAKVYYELGDFERDPRFPK